MNIFILDEDPVQAAKYQCDKHVVKMILESAQLLSGVHRHFGVNVGYNLGKGHMNHPCSIWARTSYANYDWLMAHADALGQEYYTRYGKIHKSSEVIDSLPTASLYDFSLSDLTPFAKCVPDDLRHLETVDAYRLYYCREKAEFAKWKDGNVPDWFIPYE